MRYVRHPRPHELRAAFAAILSHAQRPFNAWRSFMKHAKRVAESLCLVVQHCQTDHFLWAKFQSPQPTSFPFLIYDATYRL